MLRKFIAILVACTFTVLAAGAAQAGTNVIGGTSDPDGHLATVLAEKFGIAPDGHVTVAHYPATGFTPWIDGETLASSTRKGDDALAAVSKPGDVDVCYSQSGIVCARTGLAAKFIIAGPDQYSPYGAGIGIANRLPFIPGVVDAGTFGSTHGQPATWVSIEDDPISDSPSAVWFVKSLLALDPAALLVGAESAAAYAGRHSFQTKCSYLDVAACNADTTVTQQDNQTFVSIKPENTALVDLATEKIAEPLNIQIPEPVADIANSVIRTKMTEAKTPDVDQVIPPAVPQAAWTQVAPVIEQVAPQAIDPIKNVAGSLGIHLP